MSVFVVRAFLKMRALLGDKRELAQKLASLERELKNRLDVREAVIVTILQRVMDIIDPPALPPSTKTTHRIHALIMALTCGIPLSPSAVEARYRRDGR